MGVTFHPFGEVAFASQGSSPVEVSSEDPMVTRAARGHGRPKAMGSLLSRELDLVDSTDHGRVVGAEAKVCHLSASKAMAASLHSHCGTQIQKGKEPSLCIPPFQKLRNSLAWWSKHAPSHVLEVICKGVEHNFSAPLPITPTVRSQEDQELALKVLQEYLDCGAAKEIFQQDHKFLVPWFVVKKEEDDGTQKLRLISDCRKINHFLEPLASASRSLGHYVPPPLRSEDCMTYPAPRFHKMGLCAPKFRSNM